MRRVDGVVGNVDDDPELADDVAAHEQAGTLETVVLDDTDRKRSRLRVTTEAGTDLGVLVDRPELTAGDVLVLEAELAVVVAFERREAFVVDLPSAVAASTAVELGHRIGNQHWDIAIEDGTLYVPVEADRDIIEDVLGPYLPAAATTRYETVDAERFVDGDGAPVNDDHGHGASHEHERSHEADHGHDHSHSHGDEHSHAHE
ncbi:urease accessory protein UreE [Haloarcula salinisoli]|uniref:Urease accessory protein UreE n=1 Tax=Haloarcula salinisoli TaxID=2487746 RepID=A0A8J7YMD0_9EURY|nr:urease accessory protein UreE [Halomicroarcula salinisoli]MBX0287128.1 urease accessory protein UreE [Halomicroarcula salinisoli]MBX0304431.1 urease accessory protein UreE [Halomicroarcula salinisoli]